MGQVVPLQHIMLEIAHHGVKLGHGIADRRPGGEHHALAPGQLREVLSSVFVKLFSIRI